MATGEVTIPHLTDRESVRAEAAAQYGGLNDAAAMIQAWRATIDPNVEATALKKVNVEETRRLTDELFDADGDNTSVHEKLREHLGENHGIVEVLDAAVRGNALSVVGLDATGAPKKVVVPFNSKFKSIGVSPAEAAARANAQSEAGRVLLGAEALAEIERRVAAARDEIMRDVNKLFADRSDELTERRDAALASVEGAEPDGDESTASWPRSHDDLDKIAKDNNVTFESSDRTLDAKIAKLQAAGVQPPAAE